MTIAVQAWKRLRDKVFDDGFFRDTSCFVRSVTRAKATALTGLSTVRGCVEPGLHGRISIVDDLDQREAEQCILHEVAHVMAIDACGPAGAGHHAEWIAALRQIVGAAREPWVAAWAEAHIREQRGLDHKGHRIEHAGDLGPDAETEIAALRQENAELRARRIAEIRTLVRDDAGRITGSVTERIEP